MGYAILMQWTTTVPPGRTSISDLVLSRVLEHYNITHPMRSTVQLRTFRAHFPDAITPASAAHGAGTIPPPLRLLTTITYSLPIPPVRDVPVPVGARDDTTYLFLEDRGVPAPPPVGGAGIGGVKGGGKDGDKAATNGAAAAGEDKKSTEKKDDKGSLSDDGFEIVEAPKGKDAEGGSSTTTPAPPAPTDIVPAGDATTSSPAAGPGKSTAPARPKYQTLAVKPATLVMPTLHNLLSPFVLGLSKAARAAANTTAQAASPTPLAGTPLVLTTLAFPPTAHPHPALSLSVHILPNAAAHTIFLEGEWDAPVPPEAAAAVLKEFLLGCVPEGVPGEAKFMAWDAAEPGSASSGPDGASDGAGSGGWERVEKTRRMTSLLARALRESQFI